MWKLALLDSRRKILRANLRSYVNLTEFSHYLVKFDPCLGFLKYGPFQAWNGNQFDAFRQQAVVVNYHCQLVAEVVLNELCVSLVLLVFLEQGFH